MGNSVTQAEVESLFDKDGDLRSEPQNTAPPESEETEESEQSQESKEESQEEAELKWDGLDPRYKTAFEEAVQKAEKWQKEHGKIQSNWTKDSKARKDLESSLTGYKSKAENFDRWANLLDRHPGLEQHIESFLQRSGDPFQGAQVPDNLKENPALKYMQDTYSPLFKDVQQKLTMLEQKTAKIDEYERQIQEQEGKKLLDAQLDAAKDQIKNIFGRDATEDEVTEVLQFMVDNKFYNNGAAAAVSVFKDQYEQGIKQRYEREMQEKGKKFPPRTKSVNSARAAGPSKDAGSAEEAIAMAFAEQGIHT